MRFLVDAQLPPALARWLQEQGQFAEHVVDCGMLAATDQEIWQYAIVNDLIIISKDEDFAVRRSIASSGPAIVWIRRGNTSRRELLQWFEPHLDQILEELNRGERLIEII